jgi:hypothetical protein
MNKISSPSSQTGVGSMKTTTKQLTNMLLSLDPQANGN